jgi:hypothetical protein
LVAAVERIEQAQPKAVDATAERRRAKDRDRYHLRKPPKSTETTETVETAENQNSALSSLLSSSETTTSDKKVSKKERARKSLLPDAWRPSTAHYLKAAKQKQSETFVDGKAEDMRNWAKSKAIMRADWDATFYGFLKPQEATNGPNRKSLVDLGYELADEARELERQAGVGRSAGRF